LYLSPSFQYLGIHADERYAKKSTDDARKCLPQTRRTSTSIYLDAVTSHAMERVDPMDRSKQGDPTPITPGRLRGRTRTKRRISSRRWF
jgi:hypothetical protein